MGEVYKARDTRLDRTVAIKVLSQQLSSTPEAKTRFEREAKTIAALNHLHICTLFDIGVHQGTDYLVMEYLEGESLAHSSEGERCTSVRPRSRWRSRMRWTRRIARE